MMHKRMPHNRNKNSTANRDDERLGPVEPGGSGGSGGVMCPYILEVLKGKAVIAFTNSKTVAIIFSHFSSKTITEQNGELAT